MSADQEVNTEQEKTEGEGAEGTTGTDKGEQQEPVEQ